MSDKSSIRSVSVIGLGPMGQAMVRAFLAADIAVTVYNRTQEKVRAMVELGARPAESAAEAVAANAVTVLSLTHYDAMYEVLGPAGEALAGKVIVNLSSDSPERTRRGAAWVRGRGAEFLSGCVMSAGDNIAHPASYIFYSGPQAVFESNAELLRPLSPQEYLGVDDGVAQVFYQALLTIFHPWYLAFDQAAALIERSGHDIARFVPFAVRSAAAFPYFMEESAAAAAAGGQTTAASLRMMNASAHHIIEASREVGVDAVLSEASATLWRAAAEASSAQGAPVSPYEVLIGSRA